MKITQGNYMRMPYIGKYCPKIFQFKSIMDVYTKITMPLNFSTHV